MVHTMNRYNPSNGWDRDIHPRHLCTQCGCPSDEHHWKDGKCPKTTAWGQSIDGPVVDCSDAEWSAYVDELWSGCKYFKGVKGWDHEVED